MPIDERELKRAALEGLRHERERMDELIARLERELGSEAHAGKAAEAAPARRKRRLSAAGRANIIAALKKRWAGVKKAKTAAKRTGAGKAEATAGARRKTRGPGMAKRKAGSAGRGKKKAAPAKGAAKQAPVAAPAPPEAPAS